jgi:hypothetical protein
MNARVAYRRRTDDLDATALCATNSAFAARAGEVTTRRSCTIGELVI